MGNPIEKKVFYKRFAAQLGSKFCKNGEADASGAGKKNQQRRSVIDDCTVAVSHPAVVELFESNIADHQHGADSKQKRNVERKNKTGIAFWHGIFAAPCAEQQKDQAGQEEQNGQDQKSNKTVMFPEKPYDGPVFSGDRRKIGKRFQRPKIVVVYAR